MTRTEDTRGIVVPRLLTVFFSRAGKSNRRILYEEIAHSFTHPIPDPVNPQTIRWTRYKCHLEIFEGLRASTFFGVLSVTDQRIVRRFIKDLQTRCRVRLSSQITNPCTCTL